jgi:adenylate kinase family enzyme
VDERGTTERVCVLGPPGAGKSTFALALSRCTELPVHHMDRLFWSPGWVESLQTELTAKVEAIVAQPRWIIEGNYLGTLPLRLARAERLYLLDYRPRVYCWRVFNRVLRGYGRTRSDMAPGCPERWDYEFAKYVWRFQRDYRPQLVAMIESSGLPVVRFAQPREAAAYLKGVAANAVVSVRK